MRVSVYACDFSEYCSPLCEPWTSHRNFTRGLTVLKCTVSALGYLVLPVPPGHTVTCGGQVVGHCKQWMCTVIYYSTVLCYVLCIQHCCIASAVRELNRLSQSGREIVSEGLPFREIGGPFTERFSEWF